MQRFWTCASLTGAILLAVSLVIAPAAADSAPAVLEQSLTEQTGKSSNSRVADISIVYPGPETSGVWADLPRTVTVRGIVTEGYSGIPGYLYVEGYAIAVNELTVVKPAGYTPEVGDLVTIKGSLLDGEIIAASIKIQVGTGAEAPVEFRGVIQSVTAPDPELTADDEPEEWIVGGRTVEVDRRAVVTGEPAEPGNYAHVQGWLLTESGAVQATYVDVTTPADEAAQFEFTGVIQQMDDTVPGTWVIGDVSGTVTEDTEITGNPQVGATVGVRGRDLGDGWAVFDQIVLPETQQQVVRLAGIIGECEVNRAGAIIEGYLVVGDQRVEIEETTLLDESRGRLAKGMWAEVLARPGTFYQYALRVRVERPD